MVVLVGARPNKRVFTIFVDRKDAQIKEVAQFLEMLRDKHIPLIAKFQWRRCGETSHLQGCSKAEPAPVERHEAKRSS